jgi:SAM-dependent methyltransferase
MQIVLKAATVRAFKPLLRKAYDYLCDNLDLLLGRRDNLTPPERMLFVGGNLQEFRVTGEGVVAFCLNPGGLKPTDKVLDVGCGIGRLARPLTRYLKDPGGYEGFDIVPEGIAWCTRNITRRYPHFHFQLADLYNKEYHPGGKYKASEYRFPYDSASFDYVMLLSVFTHMLPPDVTNYLSEIARVLKRGGRCFISYFLLNAQSLSLMEAIPTAERFKDTGRGYHTNFYFGHTGAGYRTIDANVPERAVAYDEAFIRGLYERNGLGILGPIHYGSWPGRQGDAGLQDVILAAKLRDSS